MEMLREVRRGRSRLTRRGSLIIEAVLRDKRNSARSAVETMRLSSAYGTAVT